MVLQNIFGDEGMSGVHDITCTVVGIICGIFSPYPYHITHVKHILYCQT